MHAFEHIVSLLLQDEGCWTRTNYRVALSPEDKHRLGRWTCPRWEIDVLAFEPAQNRVVVVECKSFLNSKGVGYKAFSGQSDRGQKLYKLFTQPDVRDVVISRLMQQLRTQRLIRHDTTATLALAAGKIQKGCDEDILQHCKTMGWELYGPAWLKERMVKLANSDYEDEVATIALKLAQLER